jgi:ribosome biogenesis GTPase
MTPPGVAPAAMGKPKKPQREKDLTSRFLSGNLDEDRMQSGQRFTARNKGATQQKILKTALMRADDQAAAGVGVDTLPVGEVLQVYSLFSEVEHGGRTYLCVVRKTMSKVAETGLVVGDRVRFRVIDTNNEALGNAQAPEVAAKSGTTAFMASREPEAVIERIEPRVTVLTRSDSFKGIEQHPIVANAEQMLIVASLRHPTVKWGLVDRILIAARGGGLKPIVCINKIDVALPPDTAAGPDAGGGSEAAAEAEDLAFAREALAHYRAMGIATLLTSADRGIGLDALRDVLRGQKTVLAGHSGVGKSSLVRAIQPQLDLKVGEVSRYTDKGRHTTTSARRYVLDFGGAVIDTPGVKHFGLWGVTAENISEYFPDVAAGTAPEWRKQSYERILASL